MEELEELITDIEYKKLHAMKILQVPSIILEENKMTANVQEKL